jgi:hypothetical protein
MSAEDENTVPVNGVCLFLTCGKGRGAVTKAAKTARAAASSIFLIFMGKSPFR